MGLLSSQLLRRNDGSSGEVGELGGRKQHEKDHTHMHIGHWLTHRCVHARTHTKPPISFERQSQLAGLWAGVYVGHPGQHGLHCSGLEAVISTQ